MFHKIKEKLEKKITGKFEIDEAVLEQFCKENAKHWETHGEGDGYIFIGLFMVEKWVPWLMQKLIFAKGLEENTRKQPIVTDWEYNESLAKLYDSFGIRYIALKKEMFSNMTGCLYALAKATGFFLFDGSGKGILKKKYRGGNIGQFMYDTIIRTNQDIYTIRNGRNKVCFKKMWTTYWFMNSLNKLCGQYPPALYIFDDLIYDEGMIVEYMRRQGAKVLNCTMDNRFLLPKGAEGTIHWPDLDKAIMEEQLNSLTSEERDTCILQATDTLEDRFHGKNGDVRDSKAAFTGKKDAGREELSEVMGLHKDRKNVIFCAHTLSESTHRCSKQAYQDTYTWMEETMKYVRDKQEANWIIKVHPVAAVKYGEGNVLETLYEKYKSDNLYLFPDEYNSALVGRLADVVVTIYGNAGNEYSCLGIPVILAGKAVYAGLGYTIDAFTRQEYERALDNVNSIAPLSEEQVETAKLIFTYLSHRTYKDMDSFSEKLTELNWKFDTCLMAGEPVESLNNEALSFVKDYEKQENIKETNYYKTGKKYAE